MLQKIESTPKQLWMGRGSQGATSQLIIASKHAGEVFIEARRLGVEPVTIQLDRRERAALIEWLLECGDGLER